MLKQYYVPDRALTDAERREIVLSLHAEEGYISDEQKAYEQTECNASSRQISKIAQELVEDMTNTAKDVANLGRWAIDKVFGAVEHIVRGGPKMFERGAGHPEFSEGNLLYGEVFDRLFDYVPIDDLSEHRVITVSKEGRREREEMIHLLVGDEGYTQVEANRLLRGVIKNTQRIKSDLELLTPEDFL